MFADPHDCRGILNRVEAPLGVLVNEARDVLGVVDVDLGAIEAVVGDRCRTLGITLHVVLRAFLSDRLALGRMSLFPGGVPFGRHVRDVGEPRLVAMLG